MKKLGFLLACIALTFAGERNHVHSEATNIEILGDEKATELVSDTGGTEGDFFDKSGQDECVDYFNAIFEVTVYKVGQSCKQVRISNNTKEFCMPPEILTNCIATCNIACISAP